MKLKIENTNQDDVWRLLFLLAGLAAILWAAGAVLAPFFSPIVLSVIFCLTTWPAYTWLRTCLGGRPNFAAGAMVAGLSLLFIAPIALIAGSLVGDFAQMREAATALNGQAFTAPDWLTGLPYAGGWLARAWPENAREAQGLIAAHADDISAALAGIGGTLGRGAMDLGMALFIAFFVFRGGDNWAGRAKALTDRLTGPRGAQMLELSWRTMVGVVYGVLGAAVAQAVLAGVGYAIAGLPGPALLALASFVAAFLPMGTALVWGPAALWLFAQGDVGMGVFMLVWGAIVGSVDNVIRPYFIGMGVSLPFLLVLLGVLGGLMAFGFLGLFLGPVALALAYTLVREASSGAPTS